ncbi:hypothetical protein OIO90_005486 [Microbotryomycetes sp. JL221]|nr:hypothetical protein OIO90_005486 [Microbotryomycetes sp. JL221]
MSSLEKSAEHQLDRPQEEDTGKITLRSWLYALIGALLYFTISFHLAGTSVIRTSWAASFGIGDLSIWLINIISVFQACLGPPLMFCSDMFGRRYILMATTALATAGAAISSKSSSFAMAIVGQSLTGIGMCMVGCAYAIPSEVFPRKSRGAVQAILTCSASISGAVGALLGGAFIKSDPQNGWHKFLYVTTALFAATFITVAALYFPPPRHTEFSNLRTSEKLRKLDPVGYLLIIASLCLFLTGTTYGGILGWTVPRTLGPLIVGIVLMICFGLYEWKGTSTGLLHHGMFQKRNFPIALGAMAIEGVIFFNILAFVPVAASALWQPQDPFMAAAYIIPFYLASLPIFFVLGWYTTKFKEFRVPLACGYALYLAACAALSTADRNSGNAAWAYVALSGIGFAAPIALLVAVAQLAVPGQFLGACSALMVSARAVGGSIGTSIYGAILGSKLSASIPTKIAEGAFKGGLNPADAQAVLPQLIPLVASQNPELIQSAFQIPGVTPPIVISAIKGLQDAVAGGLKYVFIAGAAFSAAGILSVLVLKSSQQSMTTVIDAPAQEQKGGDAGQA